MAVRSSRAVLAKEMFFQQMRLHGFGGGKKAERFASEFDEMFENDGIVDGLIHGSAPGEGTVAGDEDARAGKGIALRKGFDDHVAGAGFVVVSNFVFGQ